MTTPPRIAIDRVVDSERRESTKSAAELKITTRDNYNYILAISLYIYKIVITRICTE